MRTDLPQAIRLADYAPPAFLIDEVHLDFSLEPRTTRVKARLKVRRSGDGDTALVLDGVRLKLLGVTLDGQRLSANQYAVTPETLTVPDVPDAFVLETEVEIDPQGNTALEGVSESLRHIPGQPVGQQHRTGRQAQSQARDAGQCS